MTFKAYKLYDKLSNVYTTEYDKLSEDQKKRINVLKRLENVALYFVEDDLPSVPALEADKEVRLEPEETIAEKVKLNLRIRKETGTGLNSKQTIN